MTTANDNTFPAYLLEASPVQRYEYCFNWRIPHPKLVQAKDELLHAIHYPGDRRIVHVFGCTGLGKTTLRLWIEKLLNEEAQEQLARDPDAIPVASVVTPSPDQGPFNWRDVYVQTMHALGEPKAIIAKKQRNRWQFIPEDSLAVAPVLPPQELRLALAGCLHMRRVNVLFYDDAQHFQMVAKAQPLQDQMDNLKGTAAVTGTKIVWVGTYDLLNLIDLRGQLAPRSVSLHFERYHADISQEFNQFASVVHAFQRHLPLIEEPNLVEQSDYLYERCLGCIGILKDWLLYALAQAVDEGEKTLTEKPLERCADVRKLVAVAKEVAAGEQPVYRVDGLDAELQGLLRSAAHLPTATSRSGQSPVPKKRPVKPGQRKANRDLVAQEPAEVVP
jgi:hypothetical protein